MSSCEATELLLHKPDVANETAVSENCTQFYVPVPSASYASFTLCMQVFALRSVQRGSQTSEKVHRRGTHLEPFDCLFLHCLGRVDVPVWMALLHCLLVRCLDFLLIACNNSQAASGSRKLRQGKKRGCRCFGTVTTPVSELAVGREGVHACRLARSGECEGPHIRAHQNDLTAWSSSFYIKFVLVSCALPWWPISSRPR